MYASVDIFAMRRMGDHLIGYAAPRYGRAPCLLELTADGIPVSVARATRFSAEAKARSLRLGWCGVALPGLSMASAIGRDLRVRCRVSGQSLWHSNTRMPIAGPPAQRTPLTVFEIVALSRKEDGSPGIAEILPILREHLRRFGEASFVNATYGTFLGRTAEQSALRSISADLDDGSIMRFVNSILESSEYRSNFHLDMIPGPFSFSFKYDLQALDEPV